MPIHLHCVHNTSDHHPNHANRKEPGPSLRGRRQFHVRVMQYVTPSLVFEEKNLFFFFRVKRTRLRWQGRHQRVADAGFTC